MQFVETAITFIGTVKYVFVINTIKIFSFLPLINDLVTIGLNFLSTYFHISNHFIKYNQYFVKLY